MRLALALLALTTTASAQWTTQNSGTTASLRGIHSLGNGVAWASGTGGTVLRTEDGGKNWLHCKTPPDAEKLDFRGVQAFNNKIAIVMSSGPGDLSRLYKTTDGCLTWKLIFTNPDKEGFWDGIVLNPHESDGLLFGDPVDGQFVIFSTKDTGTTWQRERSTGLANLPSEGGFAASNSSLVIDDHMITRFATGGAAEARVFSHNSPDGGFATASVPLSAGQPGAGIFSVGFRTFLTKHVVGAAHFVAVGGNYMKPQDKPGTAAFSVDDGHTWQAALTWPGGYRSAVAYDAPTKTWITVGPNGTDISTDDGRNWHSLKPAPTDTPDADKNWNALSLPFVVGPKGRIGVLRSGALK